MKAKQTPAQLAKRARLLAEWFAKNATARGEFAEFLTCREIKPQESKRRGKIPRA